ncbi:large T antigen [Rhinolophus simulator polyomavirus 2]|uniref:large T antigen n=1 Tax=Rhinolophus simulator polyomavirus 2 TaxID=2029305 RepID=UPI000B5FD89F|nr:large T antigen [Rhinolophus simulator polyomavirus 2]BAZ96592.1 large T antigen [Rhinolophus simulator polyomavirus 2]
MDHKLSREESVKLMELLKLPLEQYGNFPLMRKAFLQRCKVMHPDKGGDPEMAKELISLYKRLEECLPPLHTEEGFSTSQIPTYGTPEWEEWWKEFNSEFDLFCHETEFEDDPPSPNKRKAEDEDSPSGSQATPPKKKKENTTPGDIPEDLTEFLSQAIFSNKTLNCFLVYTTLEKSSFLYKKLSDKYKPTFISRHKRDDGFIFLITSNRHRVSAVLNYCRALCSVSFVIVKGVIKEYPCYTCLCNPPYAVLEESIQGGLGAEFFDNPEEAAKNVSWKLLAEFALEIMCDDLHLLIGLYKEFAEPLDLCKKCDEKLITDHYKFHKEHRENALHFLECRNQKSICQQAVDGVIAKRRVDCAQLSRKQQLSARFLKLFDKMETMFNSRGSVTLEIYMAGVCWFDCLFPEMKQLIWDYLECVTHNIPKKRYWLFTGPVNTGKTTFAAALLDLCGGKSLNVNMPFEKISFELGVAIDQFTVVFEDVKGQQSDNKKLPPGQGISNLDNLRDYLDGAVKVNLEKKHLNKKTQIFPPGIVTANEYNFPMTLKVRFCKTLRFLFHPNLWLSLRKTEALNRHRVLQNGCTLLLLLVYYCDVTDFASELHERVTYWKQRIQEEVSDGKIFDMLVQCKAGKCILSSPDDVQEDSGIFSEEQNTQASTSE